MPKRPVTPPIDDGAKYLTVVYPFPARPDMELEEHRKLFAHWAAACIGSEYFRAFYHKPSSPGSVIMEVDDALPDFKKILGAHRWSQFLKNSKEEADSETKVFYCRYHSDREVQKNGWKRIDSEHSWFINPKITAKFVFPYPQTYWCKIPKIGNVIQNDLCRPLPNRDFPPPPPPPPAPVVGTPEWQDWKRQQGATKGVRAWQRGVPPESIKGTSHPPSSAPAAAPQPVSRQAWRNANISPTSPPGLPPGLLRAGSSTTSSSSGGSARGSHSARSASPLERSSSSASSSGEGPISPVGNVPGPRVVVAVDDVQGALEALALDDEYEEDDLYYGVDTAGGHQAVDTPHIGTTQSVEVQESLWQDYVAEDDDQSADEDGDDDRGFAKAHAKNPELCRVHNVVCAKKICKEYAEQLRMKELARRKEERRMQREERENKKSKKGSSEDASTTALASSGKTQLGPQVRALPPHLRTAASPQLPPHLRKGASAATVPSPSATCIPSTSPRPQDDDARSQTSARWGTISSNNPWGRVGGPNNAPSSPDDDNTHSIVAPRAATPAREVGPWGAAPSISSAARRNNHSWSASGRGDDAASVGGRSVSQASGRGSVSDGPWGSTDAVRAAGRKSMNKSKDARSKAWAEEVDEMDEDDAKTLAGSSQWGNVSVGPW